MVSGNAEVCGNAEVFGDAEVFENAFVSGDAKVYGDARVYGDAEVYEDVILPGTEESATVKSTRAPGIDEAAILAVINKNPLAFSEGVRVPTAPLPGIPYGVYIPIAKCLADLQLKAVEFRQPIVDDYYVSNDGTVRRHRLEAVPVDTAIWGGFRCILGVF